MINKMKNTMHSNMTNKQKEQLFWAILNQVSLFIEFPDENIDIQDLKEMGVTDEQIDIQLSIWMKRIAVGDVWHNSIIQ